MWRLVLWVIAGALVIWFVVVPFLNWLLTTYTFTNRRLITRTGILTRRGHDIPMNRISDIAYEKSLIDRMFGCGTLIVSDASEHGRVELRDIPQVERAQLVVSNELHQRADRPPPGPMTAPEDLERAIIGAVPELTGEEVADAAGLYGQAGPATLARPGLPRGRRRRRVQRAPTRTRSSGSRRSSEEGRLDFDTIVRMTRAVGQTMDRLAEWEVATLAGHPGPDRRRRLQARGGAAARGGHRAATSRRCSPTCGGGTWSAAVARVESLEGAADEQVAEATVGFADLVSFSALTNRLDDDEIGDLVEVFEGRSHDVVSRRGGRVVKTLGDSVLYMAAIAGRRASRSPGTSSRSSAATSGCPTSASGVVTGAVVLRMGDVYGPAVNLAARLVGVARRNRVITDRHTAERRSPERYETRVLPARPVRGFGDLEPVAVRRTQSGAERC